ncbi:hypothetical protein LUZ61_015418 [Rhynchospora tenuis]|uniref:Glycosyltransferase n=1 Tax=Rhynchospora tenuis TaxID=198213 RepID=A0AAD5WDD6_9POAL|nr:hypothetical protein LUZ61_015418 [Rhynchospora tenuis]
MDQSQTPTTPHVVLLSSPGMGHIIPLAAFAVCLTRHHGLSVTLISNTITSNQQSLQDFLSSNQVELLSLEDPNEPPPSSMNLNVESRIWQIIASTMPNVHSKIKSIARTSHLAAIIVDPFYLDALATAKELSIPCFLFFTSNCMVLSLVYALPSLDEQFLDQFCNLPEPVQLPGCVPIQGIDLHFAVQDRTTEVYKEFLCCTKRFKEVSGVLVNSFGELEPGPTKGLKEFEAMPPVFPVGPFIRTSSTSPGQENECLRWLDQQQHGSVVFVSFGSGGALTWQQTKELALGLEMSKQNFLWVARRPNDKESTAYFFESKNMQGKLDFLPEGFLTRTEKVGLVIPDWAPQLEVLSHPAVGGFMTHCGWNSVLESVVHGVPLIAWPLYAEQRMNAVLLTDDVKVAIRPKQDNSGMIGQEEVSRVVRCLMQGKDSERLKLRAQELSHEAANSLEGGSSFKNLLQVTRLLKSSVI